MNVGRLFEELREAFALGGDPALGQNLLRGLGADDQHATHAVRRGRLIDGSETVGPVDLLQLAVAHDGHELRSRATWHVAAHHLVDLRTDDVPDFGPGLSLPGMPSIEGCFSGPSERLYASL